MNTNGSFGGWLKQRRKDLDLTQEELNKAAKQVNLYEKQLERVRQLVAGKLVLPFGRSQRKLAKFTTVSAR